MWDSNTNMCTTSTCIRTNYYVPRGGEDRLVLITEGDCIEIDDPV